MKITQLWISAFVLATTVAASGCNGCGPEQHAITTTSPNNFILGLPAVSRQVQFVNRRLTEPPATHEDFQFIFNTLEGSTNGEGVAITWSGTDAGTQEVVTLVLALPVVLRDGDDYAIGSTFSVDPGTPAEEGFWGAHDLQDPNKADVAFVISTYSFPPPVFTPNFRAVTTTGTVHVIGRSRGHVQLAVDLSFTDANGNTRTLTGNAQADNEKFAALCN